MTWLKRAPTPEKIAADAATEKLKHARRRREWALARLLEKLNEIPVEEGVTDIGAALGRKKP